MILETFFLAEEKHPYSVLFFQDLFRACPMCPIGPSGHPRRGAEEFPFRDYEGFFLIIYLLKIALRHVGPRHSILTLT
jgi:hypothetical protein